MGVRQLARETQIALSQVADLLHGRAVPRPSTRAVLIGTVTVWAGAELAVTPLRDSHDPSVVLAKYLLARSKRKDQKGDVER
jgi:hypothetical protein